jgi:hypothetical protein
LAMITGSGPVINTVLWSRFAPSYAASRAYDWRADDSQPSTAHSKITPLRSARGVRRDKAALSSGCKSRPATLQPEAAGAAMEVTKWLKPSESVSRIGDSASVQAVTRVNAEQASKRTMRRPTRQPFRGRLTRLGVNERRSTPSRCAGVVATACTQGKRTQHGKPHGR